MRRIIWGRIGDYALAYTEGAAGSALATLCFAAIGAFHVEGAPPLVIPLASVIIWTITFLAGKLILLFMIASVAVIWLLGPLLIAAVWGAISAGLASYVLPRGWFVPDDMPLWYLAEGVIYLLLAFAFSPWLRAPAMAYVSRKRKKNKTPAVEK